MSEPRGYLALLLHAHLPFVRHPEHPSFLEEDWLFEAITETYVPLLDLLLTLRDEGTAYRLTMSFTPTLCEMLEDPLLQERYSERLRQLRAFCAAEVERTRGHDAFHATARRYVETLGRVAHLYEEVYERRILAGFRTLQEEGRLEIITCAATHGFLPLFSHPQCVRAQLRAAVDNYEKHFGRRPQGVWLPECGYAEGLEEELAHVGLRFFFLDSHGILYGRPRPKYGIFAPVVTRSGVAVFGRDIESSRQVWSSTTGYPGDASYREFYRDQGYDATDEELGPLLHPDGKRRNIGVKYHCVSGPGVPLEEKRPYDAASALRRAEEHAANFVYNRVCQVRFLSGRLDRPPIIVSPYDAELFGHWWYEGPDFLRGVLRRAAEEKELELLTPSAYLDRHPSLQVVQPSTSSWGDKGYFEVWLNGANDWIYRLLHRAEGRMVALADRYPEAEGLLGRALNQAARELLLAQASDWAFIMTTGTMVDYAQRRTREHVERFDRLYERILSGEVDEAELAAFEAKDNLFPEIDYRIYAE